MCDLATASLVATGLGTAAQYEATQQSKSAMSKAQQAENERQAKMRKEAGTLFNESLGTEGAANVTKAEDKAIGEREAAAAGAIAKGTGVDAGSAYGEKSPIVATESGARSAAGKAAAGMEAAAKARLAGFGDAGQLNAIKNARMRLGQGVIANNMAGSASAHGAEMDYASHAGDSMKNLGAALSTVGMLTGMGAAAGVGATTAEELAGAQIAEGGTGEIIGADGNSLYGSATEGFTEYNPVSGTYNPYTGDFSNYVSKAHLDWANKPAFMKLFGNAPAGYVAAPSWFTKIR
jgi:hypothetical protein